jgi:uncharacterized YccA/Bax inhibitor family protein
MPPSNALTRRSSNPVLTADAFRAPSLTGSAADSMTLQGTVNKTAISLLILMATAAYTWNLAAPGPMETHGNPAAVVPWMMVGVVGGFILAMATVFKKEWSAATAPAYAALEGLALGGISVLFESRYPGIVSQAVFLTFGTLGALLMAYRSGMIKVTDNLRLGIAAATGPESR